MTTSTTRPIFCISDLHLGDGGPRDNFAYGNREAEFLRFLDYVAGCNGRLIICGDLFEFWQMNVSKVMVYRTPLIRAMDSIGALYLLGNHDADLSYFCGLPDWLPHRFFAGMSRGFETIVFGRRFLFTHGHEADPYCSGDSPGFGRITAIYTGLREDRNGGPMIDSETTVEDRRIGWLDRVADVWGKIRGKPGRFPAMYGKLRELYPPDKADMIVFGHTHRPGQSADGRLVNCGSWCGKTNSFVRIDGETGRAEVFDWIDGKPVPNHIVLES